MLYYCKYSSSFWIINKEHYFVFGTVFRCIFHYRTVELGTRKRYLSSWHVLFSCCLQTVEFATWFEALKNLDLQDLKVGTLEHKEIELKEHEQQQHRLQMRYK